MKVWTALSRPYPAGQTDYEQLSFNPDRIRTVNRNDAGKIRIGRNRTAFFYQMPDIIRTVDRIETERIRTESHLIENLNRIRTAD